MKTCMVYMTMETPQQARDIGRALIEARLAACINIIDGMKSLYWWQGTVQEGTETVVIAKTRQDAVEKLTAKVKEMHSYDCPCVVSLPIDNGHPEFLSWIEAETA